MKQILLLLLFTAALLGSDIVEEFFDAAIALEKRALDQNLSSDVLEETLEEEDALFKHFFDDFITMESEGQLEQNPYRSELFRLNRRLKANQQRGNANAVMRDELNVAALALKQNVRTSMHEVAQATSLASFKAFEKRLQQIIVSRHEKEPDLDLEKFAFAEAATDPDAMVRSIQENLDEYRYLQNIHNNLSAELIENAQRVYKAGVVSRYGILSLAVKINDSRMGKTMDPYLEYVFLSSAKLLFIMAILVLLYLLRKITIFTMRRLLHLLNIHEEDISYIVAKTVRPFTMIVILIGSELVYLVSSELSGMEWLFTLYNIVYVLMASFLIYRLGNAIAVIKMEQLERTTILRNEVINLGLKMMNGLVGLTALILILNLLDVNLTAVLSGLGIGGVAVALAAKDTIANFFGSVSILLSDLFEQGDWIAVENMEGTVVEIGLRATTLRTFDNALISIPNFRLADNGIKNWSRRTMGRRIKMKIGLTYESDMQSVRKAIVELREMLQNHPGIATEQTEYLSSDRQMKLVSKEDLKGIKRLVMVYLDEFGSSSIDIMLYCFSRSVVWGEWHEVKEDVLFRIAEIVRANGLAFAYPTMTIHQAEIKA